MKARLVAAALVLSVFAPLALPGAAACHPSLEPRDVEGYYVVAEPIGGCPHRVTACVHVWRETNGVPGLQTSGSNPDTWAGGGCLI